MHGWIAAAPLEEIKDLKRKASFESCGTERGGTDSVDEACEVHVVERGEKVESSGCWILVRRERETDGIRFAEHFLDQGRWSAKVWNRSRNPCGRRARTPDTDARPNVASIREKVRSIGIKIENKWEVPSRDEQGTEERHGFVGSLRLAQVYRVAG